MTKEKTFSPSKICHSSHWGEYPLHLNAIWKTVPVVTYEQNIVKYSYVPQSFVASNPVLNQLQMEANGSR